MLSLTEARKAFKSRSLLEKALMAVLFLLTVVLITLIATTSSPRKQNSSSQNKSIQTCLSEGCKKLGASILMSLNISVDPCIDFYEYCCGNWANIEESENDEDVYGWLEVLRSDTLKKIKDLLASGNHSSSSKAVRNAYLFYKSCTETETIESHGIGPFLNFMDNIGCWPVIQKNWNSSKYDVIHANAQVQLHTGYGFIISLKIGVDPENSLRNILAIHRPYLILPKNVLLEQDSDYGKKELENLKKFFFEIVKLFGVSDEASNLTAEFKSIIEFETTLLKAMNIEEDDDVEILHTGKYNRMTVKELGNKIPKFDWLKYLQSVTNSTLSEMYREAIINDDDIILIQDISYLQKISEILMDKKYSRQVANYLGWRVVLSELIHLPSKFYEALQDYSKNSGYDSKTVKRWFTCTMAAVNSFSDPLSLLYIQEYFPEDVKNDVMKFVYDIKFQFETTLKKNQWMNLSTKLSAIAKLNAMKVNIGHPDWLFSEEAMEANYENKNMPDMSDIYYNNQLALNTHETMEQIMKLRKNNTNDIWMILPITVNAGYNQDINGIAFPAAFLQEPLYDPEVPKFYNYAALGSIIGHEITHGFDNEGRRRNAKGEMENWWSSESEKNFVNKSECFVNQYNRYGVDGVQTLAENIADNGGLQQAYKAFKQWQKHQRGISSLPGLERFTIDQQFFLAHGSIWCTKYKYGYKNSTTEYDLHAPSPFRLRGPIANLPEFFSTFSCPEKSIGRNSEECMIW